MKKNIIIIIALMSITLTQCIKDIMPEIDTPTDAGIELYINEVLTTGDPDWAEFYNATNEDIDISDFTVSDGPTAKYTIPSGTVVPANGFYQFLCDKAVTGFSLSSGGEEFYIWDTEGNLVDQVAFDALDDGISYGRSTDGGDIWVTMSPTPGAANSTDNSAPVIIADEILNVNDNESYTYEIVSSDADGISSVKLFLEYSDIVFFEDMAPLGGGDYKINLPIFDAGDIVNYYVVSTDETGKKSYFPETAPNDNAQFTVIDGAPIFDFVNLSNNNPINGEDINFIVKASDKNGIDEIRLYYLIDDDNAENKIRITLTPNGDIWEGTIPGQINGTIIRYYLRAEDNNGNKAYYPTEEYDANGDVISDFDHDLGSTWISMTVKPMTIVINEIQGGGSPDYIELYNVTGADFDLSGYKLHDSDPTEAYTIPEGTIIATNGFYVLDCTGDGGSETLFKVSSGGEDITLLDTDDAIVDRLLEVDWPVGHSGLIGRVTDGNPTWEIKLTETKGTTNN